MPRAFGHINDRAVIAALRAQGAPVPLDLARAGASAFCESCIFAKSHRAKKAPQSQPPSHPAIMFGDRVHCDTKGPFAIPDIHGRRFAMGFIDEATGRSDVFFMHAKTDAVNARHQWESNTMHIGPTKRYRADNGSEFIDRKFQDDIVAVGSSIKFTAPYTHHPLLMERLW